MAQFVLIYGVAVEVAKYAKCAGKSENYIINSAREYEQIMLADGKCGKLDWYLSNREKEESPRKTLQAVKKNQTVLVIGYAEKIFRFSKSNDVAEIPVYRVPEYVEQFNIRLGQLEEKFKNMYDLLRQEKPRLYLVHDID